MRFSWMTSFWYQGHCAFDGMISRHDFQMCGSRWTLAYDTWTAGRSFGMVSYKLNLSLCHICRWHPLWLGVRPLNLGYNSHRHLSCQPIDQGTKWITHISNIVEIMHIGSGDSFWITHMISMQYIFGLQWWDLHCLQWATFKWCWNMIRDIGATSLCRMWRLHTLSMAMDRHS